MRGVRQSCRRPKIQGYAISAKMRIPVAIIAIMNSRTKAITIEQRKPEAIYFALVNAMRNTSQNMNRMSQSAKFAIENLLLAQDLPSTVQNAKRKLAVNAEMFLK